MTASLPFSKTARLPARFASDIITIAGPTGVGTTSTIGLLRAKLGTDWHYVSGGTIMRGFANELGITIEALAAHNRAYPEDGWDKKCDEALADAGTKNRTIIESRLGHVFVPHAFHVLLRCPLETRAWRRYKDNPHRSSEEVREEVRQRDEDDDSRYKLLYPGCLWVYEDFDFVVSTAANKVEAVCERILKAHKVWKEERSGILMTSETFEP